MALLRYAFIACLVGLVLPACTQDEDEACQVDSDCADGLFCFRGDSNIRGTCVPVGQEPVLDAGPDDDDASVDPDACVGDCGADDDAG